MKHPWSPQQFAAEAREAGRSGVIDASRLAAATIKRLDAELPAIFSLSHFAHLAGDLTRNHRRLCGPFAEPAALSGLSTEEATEASEPRTLKGLSHDLRSGAQLDAGATVDRSEHLEHHGCGPAPRKLRLLCRPGPP